MTDPDVAAELEWWFNHFQTPGVLRDSLLRARDEIVKLRAERDSMHAAMLHDSAAIATLKKHARGTALEEAAQILDARARVQFSIMGDDPRLMAAAIRALKDKG